MVFQMIIAFVFLIIASSAAARDQRIIIRRATDAHCGLPRFTEDLPEVQRLRVISIWETYNEGEKCEDRRAKTKDILASLSPAVRQRVLHHKGPAFLKGASAEVKKQFEKLWRDKAISRVEKPEKFKELAEKLLNPIQLKEFNKFHAEMERRRDAFQSKLASLSPEARAAHEKLSELREQRHRVYMEASESVKDELSNLYHNDRNDESRRRKKMRL